MVRQDRIETNFLQLFEHPETSEWFSIIPSIIFEVGIVSEQKKAYVVTIFCFLQICIALKVFSAFPCPTALPASLIKLL